MKLLLIISLFYSFFAFNLTINKPYIPVYIVCTLKDYDSMADYEKAVSTIDGDNCIKQIDQYIYGEKIEVINNIKQEGFYFVEKNEDSLGLIKEEDFKNLLNRSFAPYAPNKILAIITDADFEYNQVKYIMGTTLFLERNFIKSTDALIEKNILKSMSIHEKRAHIVKLAQKLIGKPYQWGGRTALDGGGYDCAGLVNIVYLATDIHIERSVTQQYRDSKDIDLDNLLPGDLIFFCDPKKHNQAFHVMIYVKKDANKYSYIHATPKSMSVVEETYIGDFSVLVDDTDYNIKLRRPNALVNIE